MFWLGLSIRNKELCDEAWHSMSTEVRIRSVLDAVQTDSSGAAWSMFWFQKDTEDLAPNDSLLRWAQGYKLKHWGEPIGKLKKTKGWNLWGREEMELRNAEVSDFWHKGSGRISGIDMWKDWRQPFVTAFRFHVDGSGLTDPMGGDIEKLSKPMIREYRLEEKTDFFNEVQVSFADDEENAKGISGVTKIKFVSNNGYEAHCKGGTIYWMEPTGFLGLGKGIAREAELIQRTIKQKYYGGRLQIVGVRGNRKKRIAGRFGWIGKDHHMMTKLQFCWAPTKLESFYFFADAANNGVTKWNKKKRKCKLLESWRLSAFASKLTDVPDKWSQIPQRMLRGKRINMNWKQINRWNTGLRELAELPAQQESDERKRKMRQTLLYHWELSRLHDTMEKVGYDEPPSVWIHIPEWVLESEFRLSSTQMKSWNRMTQNIGKKKILLKEWGLSEIADNVILSGCYKISEWKNISGEEVSGKLKMTPTQIRKWNDGLKKEREEAGVNLMSLMQLPLETPNKME